MSRFPKSTSSEVTAEAAFGAPREASSRRHVGLNDRLFGCAAAFLRADGEEAHRDALKFREARAPKFDYLDKFALVRAHTIDPDLIDLPAPTSRAPLVADVADSQVAAWVRDLPLTDPAEWPAETPRKRVWASGDDWAAIVAQLQAARMVVPVAESLIPCGPDGRKILSGAFAVDKKGRQRLIVDVGMNGYVQSPPTGPLSLPHPGAFTAFVLPPEDVLVQYSDDDANCFYSWALAAFDQPAAAALVARYFCFAKRAPGWTVGSSEEFVYVGLVVPPMGWEHSTDIIRHLQRRLAQEARVPADRELRPDCPMPLISEGSCWSAYIDNVDQYVSVPRGAAAGLAGVPSEWQAELRKVRDQWGLPRRDEKAVLGALRTTTLGADLDGDVGEVGVPRAKRAALMRVGISLLAEEDVFPWRDQLAAYVGSVGFCALFRRPASAVLRLLYLHRLAPGAWTEQHRRELFLVTFLLPLLQTNLRAAFADDIYATDAAPYGGCIVRAPCSEDLRKELLRSVDFRGSTVRTQQLGAELQRTRPSKRGGSITYGFNTHSVGTWGLVFKVVWKHDAPIVLLELQAFVLLARWLARQPQYCSRRFFQVFDNTAARAACAEGRSPAWRLYWPLCSVASSVLAADLYPLYAYSLTEDMPTDFGTRAASAL